MVAEGICSISSKLSVEETVDNNQTDDVERDADDNIKEGECEVFA